MKKDFGVGGDKYCCLAVGGGLQNLAIRLFNWFKGFGLFVVSVLGGRVICRIFCYCFCFVLLICLHFVFVVVR